MTVPSDSRIKVAQVRWGETTGGPERMLRDLAYYLDRKQFDMQFVFLAQGGSQERELRMMDYPVTVVSAYNGYDPSLRWQLVRELRAFQPDIIHEHGVPPFVRPVIKRAIGKPLLSFEHGEIEINRCKGKPWLNWLNGVEYRHFVERVIVNSASNGHLVEATHCLHPRKVQVIQLGLDLRRFRQVESFAVDPTPDLRLGYVGRIQNYDKGTDFLPLLAKQLVLRGLSTFKLRIVGDGPDRDSVQRIATQLDVMNQIEFLGRRDDVPELMASIDILVVPSRYEAFGLVAIEALAMGARVVAFAVGGLSEGLANCPAARLVPPGDVPAMAEAIINLWNQAGKQRSIQGRNYVAEHFDARRMTKEFEELYLEIASRANP